MRKTSTIAVERIKVDKMDSDTFRRFFAEFLARKLPGMATNDLWQLVERRYYKKAGKKGEIQCSTTPRKPK